MWSSRPAGSHKQTSRRLSRCVLDPARVCSDRRLQLVLDQNPSEESPGEESPSEESPGETSPLHTSAHEHSGGGSGVDEPAAVASAGPDTDLVAVPCDTASEADVKGLVEHGVAAVDAVGSEDPARLPVDAGVTDLPANMNSELHRTDSTVRPAPAVRAAKVRQALRQRGRRPRGRKKERKSNKGREKVRAAQQARGKDGW